MRARSAALLPVLLGSIGAAVAEGIRVLCRGFGFKLSYDGKDDGMEFPAPQTLKWNQIVGTLVDDRVE